MGRTKKAKRSWSSCAKHGGRAQDCTTTGMASDDVVASICHATVQASPGHASNALRQALFAWAFTQRRALAAPMCSRTPTRSVSDRSRRPARDLESLPSLPPKRSRRLRLGRTSGEPRSGGRAEDAEVCESPQTSNRIRWKIAATPSGFGTTFATGPGACALKAWRGGPAPTQKLAKSLVIRLQRDKPQRIEQMERQEKRTGDERRKTCEACKRPLTNSPES